MHIIAISIPLVYGIAAVCLDAFHPYFDGSCWISDGCIHASDETQCTINLGSTISTFSWIGFGIIAIVWITIIFCMSSIYLSVRKQQQTMKKYQSFQRQSPVETTNIATKIKKRKQKDNNALEEALVQSSLYIISYFFTIFWVSMADALGKLRSGTMDKQLSEQYAWLVVIATFFNPLQGFFNCLTYLRPRFLEVWKKRKDRTFMWALITTLLDRPVEEEKESMNRNRHCDTSKRALQLKVKQGEDQPKKGKNNGRDIENNEKSPLLDRKGNRRFSLRNVMVSCDEI